MKLIRIFLSYLRSDISPKLRVSILNSRANLPLSLSILFRRVLTQEQKELQMAENADQVSLLSEGFDRLSTSEVQLYVVDNLGEKGLGCITNQDIGKGDLVLREYPQLFQPDIASFSFGYIENIMKAFLGMEPKDQKMYMQLHNNYAEEDTNKWSEGMVENLEAVMDATDNMTQFENISKEKARLVWGIFEANSFHNGVCLAMSRFNHACQSNAQYFWNEDRNTRDIRALKKINKGEEITVNYNAPSWLKPTEEWQRELKNKYNFVCKCVACDLTEEQIQCENESIERYTNAAENQELQKKLGTLTYTLTYELECLEDMYSLDIEEIKTSSLRIVLYVIVERAYNVSLEGVQRGEDWERGAKRFADIGLEMSTTLNGENHSQTDEWKERVTSLQLRQNVTFFEEANGELFFC